MRDLVQRDHLLGAVLAGIALAVLGWCWLALYGPVPGVDAVPLIGASLVGVPELELAKHGVYVCPSCDHIARKPGPCPACSRHAEDASDA